MTADIRKILNVLFSRRSRIIFLLLAAAVCGGYLYRDFRLDLTTKIEKLPDVVIHNVELNKEINGKQWKFVSPKVETKNNVLYGDNLDIQITEKDGSKNKIIAAKGIFSRDKNIVRLISAEGDMYSNKKLLKMTAGSAEYDAENEIWIFGSGLELTDGRMTVIGNSGTFKTKNGDCRVNGGGKIVWEK